MMNLRKFVDSMNRQGQRSSPKYRARGVTYGFKAPVSMCLVPFFARFYGKGAAGGFKFILVVRDGRDIAFSGNQSPVTKFYRANYGEADYERWNSLPEVRGIKLWSDWNSDAAAWSQRHANGKTFDSLTVHTEDLVDPETKFETVRRIVGFVGAQHITNDELCCMVVAPEEFMGSHSKDVKGRGQHGDAAKSKLKSRYGHWQAKVEGKDALREALHREGKRGLEMFGYEPVRERDLSSMDGYQCTLTHAQCQHRGISPGQKTPSASVIETLQDSAQCHFEKHTDYKGGGSDIRSTNAPNPQACCVQCVQEPGCRFFTYDVEQTLCYFKSSQGQRAQGSPATFPSLVSGILK